MSVPGNAIQAGLAYRQAVEDAGNAVDQMMMQYGWQTPGAGGQYSSIAAGDAYDPDRVLTFDDKGKAIMTMPTVGGQYGTTGLFAESAQETAAEEAEARLAARTTGLTGGLARQREVLSETLGRQRMGGLSEQLFAGIGQQYGGVGTSYRNLLAAQVEDATMAGTGQAENVTLTDPNAVVPPPPMTEPVAPAPAAPEPPSTIIPQAKNTVGGILPSGSRGNYNRRGNPTGSNLPKNPKPGQVFKGEGGVTFVYRSAGPAGKGWYRKS